MRLQQTVSCLILIGAFAAPLALVSAFEGDPAASPQRVSDYEWFDPIIVVRRFLLDGFYEAPDKAAMQEAAIEAMVDALDDPYTVFIPQAAEAEFNKALRGTYVGIGAEVHIVNDYLTIISPLEDSPALEAGVRAGDVVLEIEGADTLGRSVDECIEQLLGEPGTSATIRVRHLDGSEEVLTLERRQIVTATVKGVRRHGEPWSYWLDEEAGIAYIRLIQFNQLSVEELAEVLARLAESSLKGLVFDLRGNPGGELSQAIRIADLFLEEGVIVSFRGRGREGKSWSAKAPGTLPDFPMIVLINRHSASASEIVAGALQHNGRAKVLGTRSFGKGSVQEIIELPQGRGTLKMTSGHYYLPGGRNISRSNDNAQWGVNPDDGFLVSLDDDVFNELIRVRHEFEIIRDDAGDRDADFSDPKWIREHLKDTQLAAGLEALQVRLASGSWPVVGSGDSTQLAVDERIESQMGVWRRLVERLERVEENLRELNALADGTGRRPLLPADADLADGTLSVYDRGGDLVSTYRLVSGDLEYALRHLQLIPIDPAGGSP